MALERMDPRQYRWYERGVVQEHLKRYDFAVDHLKGDTVLDAACGTGYGTLRLTESGCRATGIDLSMETVELARSRADGRATYEPGDASAMPFADSSFDTVVSFETIEHVPADRIPLALAEFARVLKGGGRLVISTPDRRSYSLDGPTGNQFHTQEYTLDEFVTKLSPYFDIDAVYGQKMSYGWTLGVAKATSKVLGHAFVSKMWRAYKMILCTDARVVRLQDVPSQKPMVLVIVATKKAAR